MALVICLLKRNVETILKFGKLGEVATYHILKDKVSNITYPDFEIYSVKQKSWDYDIKSTEYNIHVKTQDSIASDTYRYLLDLSKRR
jgi:hypothetical protein